MTRLYGFKWTSKEGEVDIESYGFKLWLKETSELTDEQWVRGVNRCEDEIRSRVKCGDESWPPSYVEFVQYCKESRYGAHKPFQKMLPVSEEVKEQRKKLAEQECKKILSIFDE